MIYRKISPAFWEGDLAARIRGDTDALAVAFYVMTCPAANAIGCYRLSLPTLIDDTGIPETRAREALAKLSRSPSEGLPGFLVFDESYRMVFVTEFARHEWGAVPNPKDNRTRGLPKMLAVFTDVSRKSFVWKAFGDRYGEPWTDVLEALRKPLGSCSEALAKGSSRARQDQDPDQDPDQDKEESETEDGLARPSPDGDGARAPSKAERDFEVLAAIYPNPTKKAIARDAWCRLKATDRDLDQAKAFLEVAVVSRKWAEDDGRYIPGLWPFVTARMWQDDPAAYSPARGNGSGPREAYPAPGPVNLYVLRKERLDGLRTLPQAERDIDEQDDDLDRLEESLRADLQAINADPVFKAQLKAYLESL